MHAPPAETDEIDCPRGDRWLDFVAGLNSLARFAAIEAERERGLARDRLRKQREQAAARQRRHRAEKRVA